MKEKQAGSGDQISQSPEIIICDSCHYSVDMYDRNGVCNRCLRAKEYWEKHAARADAAEKQLAGQNSRAESLPPPEVNTPVVPE
jgi:hypothetical protein